jgi:branched-chain amino acid aminotransferase
MSMGGTTAATDTATDTGTVAWVDGRIVAGEPAIRPDDRGLWGDGVFEALKVIDGVPFALRRHLDRLVASAGPIGLVFDVDAVRAAIDGVLPSAAGLPSPCWLRVTVTAGPARMAAGDRPTAPTIIAAVAPLAPWRPVTDVVVLPWRRNEHGALAGLKTISYLENGVGLRHARDRGAEEGIFANTAGNVCEGTGTNVFVVQEGRLVTPPLSAGCLAGVTRNLLLEWMPEIVEGDLPIEVLSECEEAFVTSTSRDVHPIAAIEGRSLADAPGPLTQRAMAVFAERAAATPDP